jgi:hypothetical protein
MSSNTSFAVVGESSVGDFAATGFADRVFDAEGLVAEGFADRGFNAEGLDERGFNAEGFADRSGSTGGPA